MYIAATTATIAVDMNQNILFLRIYIFNDFLITSVLCNKSTECSDQGTCGDDGTCICNDNYYGIDCSSKSIFCYLIVNRFENVILLHKNFKIM